jgi:hypothetical protein
MSKNTQNPRGPPPETNESYTDYTPCLVSPPRRIADFVRGMRVRKLNFHVTTGPIRAIIKSKFATNRRTGPDGGGG